MDTPERQHSLELDLYDGTPDFSDHVGNDVNDIQLIDGNLIDINSSNSNYQRFIRIASGQELEDLDVYFDTNEPSSYSISSSDGHDLTQMDPLERAKAEEDLRTELIKTEEEIATLRSVLSSKIARMHDLKRKLGITVWKEFRDDMEQGLKNIQESTAYQKTSQTLKTASEKTTEALGSLQASVSKKLEEVKKSSTYKSIEEKVGTAVTNVKSKVAGNGGNEGNHTASHSTEDQTP